MWTTIAEAWQNTDNFTNPDFSKNENSFQNIKYNLSKVDPNPPRSNETDILNFYENNSNDIDNKLENETITTSNNKQLIQDKHNEYDNGVISTTFENNLENEILNPSTDDRPKSIIHNHNHNYQSETKNLNVRESPYLQSVIAPELERRNPKGSVSNQFNDQQKVNKEKFSILNKKCDLIHRNVQKLSENFEQFKKKKNIENFKSDTENSIFNKNVYDIVLFIIFGIFIILLLEGVYRILVLKIESGKK